MALRSAAESMLLRCRLAANHTTSIRHSGVVTAAQDTVLDVIANNGASFGVYAVDERPARSVLGDFATLANRVLAHASIVGFSAVRTVGLVDFVGATGLDVRTCPEGRGASVTYPPARALDTAVGVTAAISILEASDFEVAAERAAWLLAGTKARVGLAKLAALIGESSAAAILTRAYFADVGPVTQLRWRTALPVASVPDHRTKRLDLIAASLPAMFWPAWLNDFRRPAGFGTTASN